MPGLTKADYILLSGKEITLKLNICWQTRRAAGHSQLIRKSERVGGKPVKDRPAHVSSLRNRVMKFLKKNPDAGPDVSDIAPEKLIEELHIHQIELEMQNEDLRLARENAERIQAKYVDLYEHLPVGYLTLAENLKIIEANLTAALLLEVEKSQLLQHPFTDFVERECQDILYFYLAQVRQSNVQESCELKLKTSGDRSFFVHLESMTVYNEESGRREIRVSFVDIHESKINSIALKESADRNEMLLNLLPHSAILLDRDRKILAANQAAQNTGVKVGDLCRAENLTKKTCQASGHEDSENVFCLVDENTYQQRLFTVINDSNDAVCLMDLQGNIKAWNRMAEKIYGYSAAAAMKMTVFDLVPPRLKQQTEHLLNDIRNGVLVKPFETKRIARDRSVVDICLKVTQLVQDGKIVAIATTERDITNHNRQFASLQKLPRQIIMAQEEEKSRISQILHAEFGQALIALKLFVVVTSADLSEKNYLIRAIFDKIRAQLDKIISNTRDLAHKLSPPGLRYVGLIPAIQELVEEATSEQLKVRFFHNSIDQASFKKKDIIIYRILQEALQNIQKHSEAKRARVTAILKKTIFTLEVSDNGRGFDPAQKSMSNGLGLPLMKQQAALIHGNLIIESNKGKGTVLKLRVPIKEKKTT